MSGVICISEKLNILSLYVLLLCSHCNIKASEIFQYLIFWNKIQGSFSGLLPFSYLCILSVTTLMAHDAKEEATVAHREERKFLKIFFEATPETAEKTLVHIKRNISRGKNWLFTSGCFHILMIISDLAWIFGSRILEKNPCIQKNCEIRDLESQFQLPQLQSVKMVINEIYIKNY